MPGVEVVSKTQRIIVLPNTSTSIVKQGPTGPMGPQGIQGPEGPRGEGDYEIMGILDDLTDRITALEAALTGIVPKNLGYAETLAIWGPVDCGPVEADAMFIPGLSVTADIGTLPVEIKLVLPAFDTGTETVILALAIYDETDDEVLMELYVTSYANSYDTKTVEVQKDDLTPGEHVFKARVWQGWDAPAFKLSASPTTPAWLSVKEIAVPE